MIKKRLSRRKLKRLVSLQDQLIKQLKIYYPPKDGWIEEWYDALTCRIAEIQK